MRSGRGALCDNVVSTIVVAVALLLAAPALAGAATDQRVTLQRSADGI
jgi:hypothetical protein